MSQLEILAGYFISHGILESSEEAAIFAVSKTSPCNNFPLTKIRRFLLIIM